PASVEPHRTWRDGDTVTVTLPKALRLEPTPDDPRRVAVLWGPLVLAGNLGLEPERGGGRPGGRGHRRRWAAAERWRGRRGGLGQPPPLIVAERPVTDGVKPVPGRPGEFRTEGALE